MKEVIFLKDFAVHKKDDKRKFDSMLASNLVRRKVAKYVEDAPAKKTAKKKTAKKED